MSGEAPRRGRSGRSPLLGERDPRARADSEGQLTSDDAGDGLEVRDGQLHILGGRDPGELSFRINATADEKIEALTNYCKALRRELAAAKVFRR